MVEFKLNKSNVAIIPNENKWSQHAAHPLFSCVLLYSGMAAYFADYLKGHGLSGIKIGLILAITPVLMFLVQPFYGMLAEKIEYKQCLLLSSGLASVSHALYMAWEQPELLVEDLGEGFRSLRWFDKKKIVSFSFNNGTCWHHVPPTKESFTIINECL